MPSIKEIAQEVNQSTDWAGMRKLGRVLNAILSGERNPDLADLPPDLADKVRGVLAQLGE